MKRGITMKEIGRLGTVYEMKNGQKATCIEYNSAKDITVQFEDGYIVEHVYWVNFRRGLIKNTNYSEHLGQSRFMTNGQQCKLIAYRHSQDCDFLFEDGTKVEHKRLGNWLKGNIANPNVGLVKSRRKEC